MPQLAAPGSKLGVRMGGPVQPETLHFLHRGNTVEDSGAVTDIVNWGGDFAALQESLASGMAMPSDVAFFLGYSGWAPGQLEAEIAEETWVVADSSPAHVFETTPDHLWRGVLREMGGDFALLANYPKDLRHN